MVVRYINANDSSESASFKVLIGRVVHSRSLDELEILPRAAVGVRPDGTIAFVETRKASPQDFRLRYAEQGFTNAETTVLKRSQFLFPGLVDTHLHAPQWPNLALGMEGNLREWVENWTDPMEASYKDNDKAWRVYSDVTKTTLKLGTTTVAYNSTIHAEATNILAECAMRAGQRAIIGKLCILTGSTCGNWEKTVDSSLEDAEKSVQHIRKMDPDHRLVHACIQPRGGPYCPPALMSGLGELRAKYDAYVQAHCCETEDDKGSLLF
jgi:guanine deaminase